MLREHKPLIIEDFNGLYARGDAEACPEDHFIQADNIQYIQSGFKTRDAIDPYQVNANHLTGILRVYTYMMQSGESLLVLTTGGKIYHVIGPSTTYGPILTIPSMTDFGFQAIAGRAYITPFASSVNSFGVNSEIGLQNQFLYVYKGDGTSARKAAGFPPTNGSLKPLIAYNVNTLGGVTAGIHAIAVAYKTSENGTLGPEVLAIVNAPGSQQIRVNNLPIGPAGTISRLVVMTKATDLATVTDDVTKTYAWATGLDGWTDQGLGLPVFSYDNTDHSVKFAGNFALSTATTNGGISAASVTWEDLGVPPGAVVVSVKISAWKRKVVANDNVVLAALSAIILGADGNNVHTGLPNLVPIAYTVMPATPDGSYTAMTAGLTQAVNSTYGPSGTEIQLILKFDLETADDAIVDMRFDDVALEITYAQLVTSFYNGDPALFNYYEAVTIPDNVTISTKINVADASLTSLYTPGGTPPTAPITNALLVQNVDMNGYCDMGLHLIGVVYETDTGFLTAPGPEYLGAQTFIDTTRSVKVSNIPLATDPSVIKRHLVSTLAITNYSGNPLDYQFFFIPDATLEDNTTTEWTGSYYDSDLKSDASHLTDNFSEIPAFVGLTTYHGRLVGYGEYDNISLARVSAPGEPEAISQVDGLIIAPLDGYPLTNAQEYRDTLYLFKRARTIACSDNNDVPSSWIPITVDQGAGASVHGVTTVLDSGGVNIDFLIIANYSGIMMFNGVYVRPELSWKIADLWSKLNKNDYRYIQAVNDSVNKKGWITLPPPYQKELIHVDYANGLDPKSIRFSLWKFSRDVQSVTLTELNKLILGGDGILYINPFKVNKHDSYYDRHEVIPNPTWRLAYTAGEDNVIHVTGTRVRVTGKGNLRMTMYSLDDIRNAELVPLVLNEATDVIPTRLCNFTSQRASLCGYTNEMGEYFKINRVTLYTKEIASSLPG